jgi:hypothetical protein
MSTFAGMHGRKGFSGDGLDATSAELQSPSHVFVSSWGDVFITDRGNSRIRKVRRGGARLIVALCVCVCVCVCVCACVKEGEDVDSDGVIDVRR